MGYNAPPHADCCNVDTRWKASPLLTFHQTSTFPAVPSGLGFRLQWPSNVVLRTP